MRKYRILVLLLIFLLSGLIIYSFANPADDENPKKKDNEEQKEIIEEKTEEEDNEDLVFIPVVVRNTTNPTTAPIVDQVAPTGEIEYDPTTWTKGNVTATITFSETVQPLVGWTKVSDTEYEKVYEHNTQIPEVIMFKDLANNEGTVNVLITNIDKVAPTIDNTLTVVEPTNWTNGDVTITLTATDNPDGSGVDPTSFTCVPKQDEVAEATMMEDCVKDPIEGNKFKVHRNGTYQFTVKDIATNQSEVYEVKVTNIDKMPPCVNVTGNPTEWTNSEVTLTVNAHDNNPLPTEAYSYDEGSTWVSVNTYNVTTNGSYNVWVRDVANNITKKVVEVTMIDTEAPIITINIPYVPHGPKNELRYELDNKHDIDVSNIAVASDSASFLKSFLIEYINEKDEGKPGKEWTEIEGNVLEEKTLKKGEYLFRFTAIDNALNEEVITITVHVK